VLQTVPANAKHCFRPAAPTYLQIRWHAVLGHRQMTDAYLAGQARYNSGKLVSFDKGLVALHPGVGKEIDIAAIQTRLAVAGNGKLDPARSCALVNLRAPAC
jgi:hypothetical protein